MKRLFFSFLILTLSMTPLLTKGNSPLSPEAEKARRILSQRFAEGAKKLVIQKKVIKLKKKKLKEFKKLLEQRYPDNALARAEYLAAYQLKLNRIPNTVDLDKAELEASRAVSSVLPGATDGGLPDVAYAIKKAGEYLKARNKDAYAKQEPISHPYHTTDPLNGLDQVIQKAADLLAGKQSPQEPLDIPPPLILDPPDVRVVVEPKVLPPLLPNTLFWGFGRQVRKSLIQKDFSSPIYRQFHEDSEFPLGRFSYLTADGLEDIVQGGCRAPIRLRSKPNPALPEGSSQSTLYLNYLKSLKGLLVRDDFTPDEALENQICEILAELKATERKNTQEESERRAALKNLKQTMRTKFPHLNCHLEKGLIPLWEEKDEKRKTRWPAIMQDLRSKLNEESKSFEDKYLAIVESLETHFDWLKEDQKMRSYEDKLILKWYLKEDQYEEAKKLFQNPQANFHAIKKYMDYVQQNLMPEEEKEKLSQERQSREEESNKRYKELTQEIKTFQDHLPRQREKDIIENQIWNQIRSQSQEIQERDRRSQSDIEINQDLLKNSEN